MYEQIPAILLLDETIPLFLVKPFDRTLCQSTNLLLLMDRSSLPSFRSPLWQRTHPSKACGAGTPNMDAARPLLQWESSYNNRLSESRGKLFPDLFYPSVPA